MVDVCRTTAMSVLKLTVFCLTAVALCQAEGSGEYIITHTPSHVTFRQESQAVLLSQVPDVVASTFGFSINKDLTWDGLGQTSLFARPKANVVVSVAGVPDKLNIKSHARYEAKLDDAFVNTESVVNRLQANIASNPLIVDFSADNTLFDIKAEQSELFKNLPVTRNQIRDILSSGRSSFSPADLGTLNVTENEDVTFLGELHIIRQVIDALKNNPAQVQDNVPDFYHLKIAGLQGLVARYGKASSQVEDAKKMLEAVLDELTKEFRSLYSGNLVIQIVTSEAVENQPRSRHVRSLLADEPKAPEDKDKKDKSNSEKLGVATVYSDMFPVMFNIILWGSITLVLALYGISYGIWVMDPGKDSIIYRMTSQRLKTD